MQKIFEPSAKIVLTKIFQCYPDVLSHSQMLKSVIGCMMIVNHVTINALYIGTRSRPLSLLSVGLNSLKDSR